MKVGFFLGSFNPVHNGHIRIAEKVIKENGLDKVIFVPTMQNPFKQQKPVDIETRAQLIKLSLLFSNCKINDKPLLTYCKVDISEKELTPPFYSYKILKILNEKYADDERFIICGQDTIEAIPQWKNGEDVLRENNFIVCERTNESSTEVRQCVKENNIKRLSELVPSWLIKKIMYLYEHK